MKRRHLIRSIAIFTVTFGSFGTLSIPLRAADAPPATQPTTRPQAKPLSKHVVKSLAWLASQQQPDGGWTQGEVSKENGREGEQIDRSNVADTCMAALAFLRSGSTAGEGPYRANVSRALGFVCGQVEKASLNGLLVTEIQGTRTQTKLGQYIDTFATALLLAEARNSMPNDASRARVAAALDKTLAKIQKNQKEDGHWADAHDGWASALCQSVATQAVNRAAQSGANVNPVVVDRAQKFAVSNYNAKTDRVEVGDSAGVELYSRGANLQAFQQSANTYQGRSKELAAREAAATTQASRAQEQLAQAEKSKDAVGARAARKAIEESLVEWGDIKEARSQIDGNAQALQQAQGAVLKRLDDKNFVAGFGSNGGEEFLSYMNIGEKPGAQGRRRFRQMGQVDDREPGKDSGRRRELVRPALHHRPHVLHVSRLARAHDRPFRWCARGGDASREMTRSRLAARLLPLPEFWERWGMPS